MKKIQNVIETLSKGLNILAGFGIFIIMIVVVVNVLMREIFNAPITGSYEYVEFLTAAVIGLSVSWCAVKNGHIAIEILFNKWTPRIQRIVEIICGTVSLILLLLLSRQMFIYAGGMLSRGEVSPTTQTPYYPFVAIVGLGLLMLSFVLFVKVFVLVKGNKDVEIGGGER